MQQQYKRREIVMKEENFSLNLFLFVVLIFIFSCFFFLSPENNFKDYVLSRKKD
jgi:hypothetical protein